MGVQGVKIEKLDVKIDAAGGIVINQPLPESIFLAAARQQYPYSGKLITLQGINEGG
jgi:hypothetical protein